jgi:hypothetical protein
MIPTDQLPLFDPEQAPPAKPGAGQCLLCGAPIIWRDHETTGRAMPIDPEPDDAGNVVLLDRGRYRMLPLSERAPGQVRYTSHMGTCPVYVERAKRRRAKGNRADAL